MFPRDYPTITAGRTLLNCSPAQFDQYLDPTRYVPRTGAIEELATQLGYTCTEQEGLHTIHNADGVRVIDGVRSRRAAYREWWRKVGLQEATSRYQTDAHRQSPRFPHHEPDDSAVTHRLSQ